MTTQVSITTSPDGSVLLALPKMGMNLKQLVSVGFSQGILRIKQGNKVFVQTEFDDLETIFSFKKAEEFLMVEVDDSGIEFFEKVKRDFEEF